MRRPLAAWSVLVVVLLGSAPVAAETGDEPARGAVRRTAPDRRAPSGVGAGLRRVALGPDVVAVDPEMRDVVDDARGLRDEIAGHLGRTLPFPIHLGVDRSTEEGLEGEESVEDGACVITITPEVTDGGGGPLESTLGHEIFHCFQDALGPVLEAEWVTEGSAEWVGETLAGGTRDAAGDWDGWLGDPTRSLFRRDYDAIGFFAVLSANGIDPWTVFDAMLVAAGNEAAYAAAVGGGGDEFLTTIAKALVRRPALGADWESTGPGITRVDGSTHIEVTPDETEAAGTRDTGECGPGCAGRPIIEYAVPLRAFSTAPFDLQLGGDVLQVMTTAPQATLGFDDGSEVPLERAAVQGFCLDPAGCVCEDGGAPLGGAPLAVGRRGLAGLALASGDPVDARLGMAAMTIDDACAVGTGIDRCLLGRWQLDVPALSAAVQDRLGDTGAEVDASGNGELRFRPRSYEGSLDLALHASRTIDPVGPVTAEVLITGGGSAGWSSDGFGLLPSDPATEFHVTVNVVVGGRTVQGLDVAIPGAGDIGEGLFAAIAYTCPSRNTLVMTPPGGYPVTFRRADRA